jgi:hypothetical protein
MATTFNGRVAISVEAVFEDVLDISTASVPVQYTAASVFTDGTGANQAKKIFTDTRTLSASAAESLDLYGSLADAFGVTMNAVKLKAIIVSAASGNTNNVQVTRPASNGVPLFMAASDGIALTPGASFCAVFPDANGVAVTASTGDLITFTNSAGSTSVTYTLILIYTV